MKLTEKRLNIKSILLVTVILPAFVIFISGIAIYFTAKSVQPGSVFDVSVLEESKSRAPENAEAALGLLQDLINDAADSGILKFTGHTSAEIRDISCKNENIGKVLSFISGSLSSHLESYYEDSAVNYGENALLLKKLLPESTPEAFDFAETDGVMTLTLTYSKVFGNMYFSGTDKTAITMFAKENESVFSSAAESLVPADVKYTLTADEETGKILSFEINREYTYTSTVTFRNTLAKIGTASLSMTPVFNERYEFSYAGIEIEEDIKTLTKNGYDTLTVTPFTEANLSEDKYKLQFFSSDPESVTVDENGQVTAVKESEKPAVITVELQYLGRTFTDSCSVYSVKPVERVTVSDTALTLKVGDTATLEAEVTPDDATIKTVKFYSADKSIAAVNEKGEITAISDGTVTVTAYSEQGFIAAECTVTVTK